MSYSFHYHLHRPLIFLNRRDRVMGLFFLFNLLDSSKAHSAIQLYLDQAFVYIYTAALTMAAAGCITTTNRMIIVISKVFRGSVAIST